MGTQSGRAREGKNWGSNKKRWVPEPDLDAKVVALETAWKGSEPPPPVQEEKKPKKSAPVVIVYENCCACNKKIVDGYFGVWQIDGRPRGTCSKKCEAEQEAKPKDWGEPAKKRRVRSFGELEREVEKKARALQASEK